jgi:hypothetical protein
MLLVISNDEAFVGPVQMFPGLGPHEDGLPGNSITRDSSTLSGGYSSGGESMHFTPSGTLVADGETTKAG